MYRMRSARFFWPIPGRVFIAGCMWIIAFGRLGLYEHSSTVLIGDQVYGALMLWIAIAVVATEGKNSLRWFGRTVSALGAGACAVMAVDLLLSSGSLNTSSMMLVWLSIALTVQAGARREC